MLMSLAYISSAIHNYYVYNTYNIYIFTQNEERYENVYKLIQFVEEHENEQYIDIVPSSWIMMMLWFI